jgi:hypothetical protein
LNDGGTKKYKSKKRIQTKKNFDYQLFLLKNKLMPLVIFKLPIFSPREILHHTKKV